MSPSQQEESRRLSIDPVALQEVLNSTNFNKEAVRNFLNESLGEALHQVNVTSATQEEKPLLELHFSKGLRNKTVDVGKDFALTVELSHTDQLAEWALDGMDLIQENSDKYTFVSEGRVHVLIVHDTVCGDEGDYSCTVAGSTTVAFIAVNGKEKQGQSVLFVESRCAVRTFSKRPSKSEKELNPNNSTFPSFSQNQHVFFFGLLMRQQYTVFLLFQASLLFFFLFEFMIFQCSS